ncbi:MAG: zinc-dependent metalloprotease, partial [Acidimicrobiales bacterium]
MSSPSPFGGGNPLEHLLGDLLKLISNAGPVQWDLARQLAHAVATDGVPEPNVDPVERIRLEELVRVADLHVSDATGMATSTTGGLVTVRPVGRSEWAWRTLDAWRPLLESLATALSRGPAPRSGHQGHPSTDPGRGPDLGPDLGPGRGPDLGRPEPDLGRPEPGDLAGFLGSIGQVMGPTLLGLQVGSALGHLARRAMGPYV